jgi:hypothetical protein
VLDTETRMAKAGARSAHSTQLRKSVLGMQVPADEAKEAYPAHVVRCLQSNDTDDLEANVERIAAWCKQFRAERSAAGAGGPS